MKKKTFNGFMNIISKFRQTLFCNDLVGEFVVCKILFIQSYVMLKVKYFTKNKEMLL